MLSFKPAFSLSSFTFIKRLFSSSLLSAIMVVSSAYLTCLERGMKGNLYMEIKFFFITAMTNTEIFFGWKEVMTDNNTFFSALTLSSSFVSSYRQRIYNPLK